MLVGHNSQGVKITVEVRLFNSISRFADTRGQRFRIELDPGATVSHLAETLNIPEPEIFLVLVNGRDVTRGRVGDPVRGSFELEDGDVVALSGAVPYSWGYGSPVV